MQNESGSTRYLRITSVMRSLDVHRGVVYREIRSGRLKAAKFGREWRVKPLDLETYLRERTGKLRN